MRMLRVAALGIVAALVAGCAQSGWVQYYKASPKLAGTQFKPTDQVDVRVVEVERLKAYNEQERKLDAESKVAPEDRSPEQRREARGRLLEAIRLREDPSQIAVLGWSDFNSPRIEDPHSGVLARFAQSKGADYVIVTSIDLGEHEEVHAVPMTSYSSASAYGSAYGPGGSVYANAYGSGTTTTFVPMRMMVHRWGYYAIYLRKVRAEDVFPPGY